MSEKFQKKTSSTLVTVLIGFIVVAFMFGGYQTVSGVGDDTIAKVGTEKIKFDEYEREYSRQLSFYKQIFGGKDLTSKQIKQFGVKQKALSGLVNYKLMINLSDDLGIFIGKKEVAEFIKKQPYFQTNGKFDIELYKNKLRGARLTPQKYEDSMKEEIARMQLQTFMQKFPVSGKYISELNKFKSQKLQAELVQISVNNMQSFIEVNDSEVSSYLKTESNSARVKEAFKARKKDLDKEEKVLAHHILMKTTPKNEKSVKEKITKLAKKITTKNFMKMASKYTEDPSGKERGGKIGWFAKGKMVPAFEKTAFTLKKGAISKPVKTRFGYHIIYVVDKQAAKEAKLEDHKNAIAKEFIQKSKSNDAKKLAESIAKQIEESFKSADVKKIKALVSKYDLTYDNKTHINRLNGAEGSISISPKNIKEIFASVKGKTKVFKYDSPLSVTIVKAMPLTKEPAKEDQKSLMNKVVSAISKEFQNDLLEQTRKTTKIKVYKDITKF